MKSSSSTRKSVRGGNARRKDATSLRSAPAEVSIRPNVAKEDSKEQDASLVRRLMDESNDAVFVIDAHTSRYLDFNKTACDHLGYSRAELRRLGVIDVAKHITDMDVWKQRVELISRSGGQLFETSYRRKDGTHYPVEVSAKMLEDADHLVMIAIARDISERKKVQEILLASEKYFRALIENSSDGVALGNAEGIITYASPSTMRMLGYSNDEFVGQAGLAFVHPEDQPRLQEFLVAIVQKPGASVAMEYRIRHKNGSWKWIEATVQNLLADPAVRALVGNYRDITERKEAGQALAQSEQRFRALIEHSLDNISLITADGMLLWESPTALRMLGYAPDEFIGHSVFDLIHPEERGSLQAQFSKLAAEPGNIECGLFRMRASSGAWRWVEAVATNLLDEPSVQAIVINYRDVTKNREAEEELRASEERYRRIANTVPGVLYDYIAYADGRRTFAYVGPRATEILELEPLDLMRDASLFRSLIHANDLHRFLEEDEFANSPTAPFNTEVRVITRSGREKWIQLSSRQGPPQKDGSQLSSGIMLDITERKLAEQHLRESEERFHELSDNIEEVFWITDPKIDEEIYISPAAERIWGRQIKDRQEYFSCVFPEDLPYVKSKLEEQARGERAEMEYRILRPDGSVRWVWDRAFPVFDENGKLARVAGISADVTHRKQAEEDLRLSEARYRAVVENQSEFVLRWKPNGARTFANEAYRKYFGLTEANAADSFVALVLPEDRAMIEDKIARLVSGEVSIETELHRVIKANGEIAWNEWTDQAIYDESGQLVEFQSVGRDVTERKKAEESIQEHAAELERRVQERTAELTYANRAKDEFLANMSHELRTPLNSILGFSETLLDGIRGPLSEKQTEAVDLIAASGKHLLGLINDVLDVSKIEAGKFEIHPEIAMVEEICQSSLNLVRELANKKSITLEHTATDSDVVIYADPRRLKQILVNLLSNAVKFTPDHGRVSLDVQLDARLEQITFEVSDTGIGIALEDLGELFNPFVQLDSRLTRQFEGSGLGLALVQKLVGMHSGKVQVESELGKGSRFTVVLPWNPQLHAEESHPTDDARRAAADPAADRKPGSILLVEDSEANVMVVKDYLEARGHSVRVARNGVDALEAAARSVPGAIVMDIQMPQMDGIEAIRRLRQDARFAHVPIIAVTAFAMPGDRERILAAGADEYLSKPVVLKSLRETIERLL